MNDAVLQFAIRVLKTSHISARIVQPYFWNDPIPFDLGLREGIHCAEVETKSFLERLCKLIPNTVYHITDSFGCLYTAFPLTEVKDKVLLIGPTMENEDWDNLCDTISAKRKLPPALRKQLKDYYLRLPKLSLISGYHSVVLELGKYLYAEQMNVRYIQDETNQPYRSNVFIPALNKAEKPIVSMQMMEERYDLENSLLEAVRHGNNTLALQALEMFNGISIPYRPDADVPSSVQYHLVGLNAMLRKEAERAEVHPIYLNELSDEMISAASKVKTEQSEYRCGILMINSYCNLVKRFSMSGYSPIVRNVIRYANSHISEDLSLRTLADRFNVNRSYLSALFKKETGIQFTEYINGLRIEYAAGLLAKQQLSITEAASMVGFSEVPYFNRLFKRIKNQTPAQFVKDHRKNNHADSEGDS